MLLKYLLKQGDYTEQSILEGSISLNHFKFLPQIKLLTLSLFFSSSGLFSHLTKKTKQPRGLRLTHSAFLVRFCIFGFKTDYFATLGIILKMVEGLTQE